MKNRLLTIKSKSQNHSIAIHQAPPIILNPSPLIQSQVQNKQSMANMANSTISMFTIKRASRVRTYQDVSYLELKHPASQKLSLIAKDPQLYQQKFNSSKSDLYLTMYKMGGQPELKASLMELKTDSRQIDLGPLLSKSRVSDFKQYLSHLVAEKSKTIQECRIPANRQQVIELQEWFETMSKKLSADQTLSPKDLASHIQTLLSVSLKELVRQVGIECKERGNLLQLIWTYYVDFFESIITNYKDSYTATTRNNEEDNEITLQYQSEITQIERLNQELLSENQALIEQVSLLEQKNIQLVEKVQYLSNDIQSLKFQLNFSKDNFDRVFKELQQAKQQDVGYQPKKVKQKSESGQSIVAHLLARRNQITDIPKSTRASLAKISPMQETTVEDGVTQIVQTISDIGHNAYTPRISRHFHDHPASLLIVDERDTQTEPIIYNQIPIIHELICCLIEGNIDQEQTIKQNTLFTKSMNVIENQNNISIVDKKEISATFESTKLLLSTFGKLHSALKDLGQSNKQLSDEQEVLQKKSQQQMLEINEKHLTLIELEELLKDTASDFIDVLKRKQKKIVSLKKSNSAMLIKLNSFTQEEQISKRPKLTLDVGSQNTSPFKVTPSFNKGFNFKTEDGELLKEEQSDDEQSQQELSNKQISEVDDAEYDEQDVPLIHIQPTQVPTGVEQSHDDSAVTPTIAFKSDKLNMVIKKYGLMNRGARRFTKPIQIKSSLLQQLGNEKKVRRIYSQNTDAAKNILKQITNTASNNSKCKLITQAQVNKIVCSVMLEAGKTIEGYKVPLNVGIYDFFIHKYGFKQVAEKKIKQVLMFIYHKRESDVKVQLLARMCYMNGQMDEMLYKLVIQSQRYFQTQDPTKWDTLIPNEQIVEYCNEILLQLLGGQYISIIHNQLKLLSGVTFSTLMLNIISAYFQKKEECQNILKLIFSAADLDGNNLIQYHEFKNLYQAIHPDIYKKSTALDQFLNYADYIEEVSRDKMITLPRFTEMAMELNLFTQDLITEYGTGYQNLITKWEEEKDEIKYRYLRAKKYQLAKFSYSQLDEQITHLINGGQSSHDMQTLWVSYRLLAENSLRVILNYETRQSLNEMLPQELIMISVLNKQMEEL